MFLQDNDWRLVVFQLQFNLGKLVLIGQYILPLQFGWVMVSSSANCESRAKINKIKAE
jgi:hypothetical protein